MYFIRGREVSTFHYPWYTLGPVKFEMEVKKENLDEVMIDYHTHLANLCRHLAEALPMQRGYYEHLKQHHLEMLELHKTKKGMQAGAETNGQDP